ncbi:phosphotransferase [Lentibacillus saliphilus]|uniref:phosphotransferase n=1 Tax=Lentibacillus saliphilus TaxID=2737028 RepID=UPI001C301A0D|nr:phosphotransferase [Lentibacillus saliphilus]
MEDDLRIQSVLKSYHIQPSHITAITDRLFYVEDGRQQYAVKQSRMSPHTALMWRHVYDVAHTKGLKYVLPVFVTKEGMLFERRSNTIYYVTPWLEERSVHEQQRIRSIYDAFGYLHETTRQTADVDHTETLEAFVQYEQLLIQKHNRLLQLVTTFEQQHYMSPFQLQVCTHFVHIDIIMNVVLERINTLAEALKTDPAQTVCLCHGQFEPDHVIYRHQPYIINWEVAHYGHPMQDLADFLHRRGTMHRTDDHLWIEELEAYFKSYTSTHAERVLLSIYLLDPLPYITMVEDEVASPKHVSMLERVQQIEQIFRRLRFGMSLVEQMDQMTIFNELESDDDWYSDD